MWRSNRSASRSSIAWAAAVVAALWTQGVVAQSRVTWSDLRSLGDEAQRAREPALAIAYYERALQIRPLDTSTRVELARVLFFSKRTGEALAEAEQILAVEPANVEANTIAAEIHMRTEYEFLDYPAAVELLRTALEASRRSPARYADTCHLLGRALARAGRFCEARATLRECPASRTYRNETIRCSRR